MRNFTDEELRVAKQTDLVDVAERLGYTPVRIGRYYSLKEMDSIRIYDRSNWYRWSRRYDKGCNGGTQIDFLRVFNDMNVKDAVFWLLDFAGYDRSRGDDENYRNYIRECIEKKAEKLAAERKAVDKKEFVLPERAQSEKRVFGYLCNERCISAKTVSEFIKKGILYESDGYHNAVFLGKSADGTVKFASRRGTYDLNGKGFKCDVAGNDKRYGVNLVSEALKKIESEDGVKIQSSIRKVDFETGEIVEEYNPEIMVHVFEAAIDMMSYADIEETTDLNMIALGMLGDAPLETYLSEHPSLRAISFHLDNDQPGRAATEKLMEKYYGRGYEVLDEPAPAEYKDFNEYLQGMSVEKNLKQAR